MESDLAFIQIGEEQLVGGRTLKVYTENAKFTSYRAPTAMVLVSFAVLKGVAPEDLVLMGRIPQWKDLIALTQRAVDQSAERVVVPKPEESPQEVRPMFPPVRDQFSYSHPPGH